MPIITFKILAILLIIAAGVIGGFIPVRVRGWRQSERWLLWGNAFSGGIFLSAGLLHLLADADEHLAFFAPEAEYPYVLFICGIGFLFVFFLERVLLRAHDPEQLVQRTGGQQWIFIVVLSVHSVIAGAALGLETEFIASLALFIAIIAHKGFAAFALGATLLRGQMPVRGVLLTIGLFALMTPLGILGGSLFGSGLDSHMTHGAEALFDALAAGTFVYVSVLEIIEDVFEAPVDLAPKFWLMSSGFAAMALLALWA